MKRRRARWSHCPVCLSVIVCLAGLASGAGAVSAADELAAPSSVAIGHTNFSAGAVFTPLVYAAGAGYFHEIEQKFHTTIHLETFGSPPQLTAAFFGGSVQFVNAGASNTTVPASQGKDIVGVFLLYTGTSIALVGAAKYQATRGANLAAYKDATWCYTVPASVTQFTANRAATAAGLVWSSLKTIAVGSTSAFLPTMEAGRCDISAMDYGNAARAVDQHIGYVAGDYQTAVSQVKVYGGVQIGPILSTSHAFAKQYPALTQAIVEALVKAQLQVQKYAENPKLIWSRLPSEFTSAVPLKTFLIQWALCKGLFLNSSGVFSRAAIFGTLAAQTATGDLVRQPDIAATFDNTYTLQAYKNLGLPTPPESGAAVQSPR